MDIYFDLEEIGQESDFFSLASDLLCVPMDSLETMYRCLLQMKNIRVILLDCERCPWSFERLAHMFKKAHRHNRKFSFRLEAQGRTY